MDVALHFISLPLSGISFDSSFRSLLHFLFLSVDFRFLCRAVTAFCSINFSTSCVGPQ